jgi:hypothetical protein
VIPALMERPQPHAGHAKREKQHPTADRVVVCAIANSRTYWAEVKVLEFKVEADLICFSGVLDIPVSTSSETTIHFVSFPDGTELFKASPKFWSHTGFHVRQRVHKELLPTEAIPFRLALLGAHPMNQGGTDSASKGQARGRRLRTAMSWRGMIRHAFSLVG